jgi:hypothetical protein
VSAFSSFFDCVLFQFSMSEQYRPYEPGMQLKPWESVVLSVCGDDRREVVYVDTDQYLTEVARKQLSKPPSETVWKATKLNQYNSFPYTPATHFLGVPLSPVKEDDEAEKKTLLPEFLKYVHQRIFEECETNFKNEFHKHEKEYDTKIVLELVVSAIRQLLTTSLNGNRHLTLGGLINLGMSWCTNLPEMATPLSYYFHTSQGMGVNAFLKWKSLTADTQAK